MRNQRVSRAFPKLGVAIRRSNIHGFGVFALREFKRGDFVGIITGHILRDRSRLTRHSVTLKDSRGLVWSLEPGEPFRFLNHSLRPNAVLPGCHGPCLYAARKIPKGNEITIHYGRRWRHVK